MPLDSVTLVILYTTEKLHVSLNSLPPAAVCQPVFGTESVITFPDFFIKPEQNLGEAIAGECWEMVPESMKFCHCGAVEIKWAVSWHAAFRLSQNKTQSFALMILCRSLHFRFQQKRCLLWLGCSTCLVPGTPRRRVSRQMSLYAAFPGLWLSPYLAWLDKGYLMVLLRSTFRGQKGTAGAGRSYELLSNKWKKWR